MKLQIGEQNGILYKSIDDYRIKNNRKLSIYQRNVFSEHLIFLNILPEITSAAQIKVCAMIDQFMTNNEIAAALFISHKTVRFHKTQIYKKLGVKSEKQFLKLMSTRRKNLNIR